MVAQEAIVLRPRGVGELFDQAIRLYRKHFLKFIGIIAVAQIPVEIIRLIVSFISYRSISNQGNIESPSLLFNQTSTQLVPLVLYSLLTFLLVTCVANAALTSAINKSYLGEEISIEDAYRQIRGRWRSLLGALLLVVLFNIPVLIWSMIPCVGWISGLGIFFFVNAVMYPLIAPIIIIEHRPAGQALRRAWDLARRRFWWLCGFFLLLYVFGMLVVQGPVTVLSSVLQIQMQSWVTSSNINAMVGYQYALSAVVSLFSNLLYLPLLGTCASLAYFDLRIRHEGLDLALLANEAEAAPIPATDLARQSPALDTSRIITSKEMGYFSGLSLLGGALYFLLVIVFYILILALAAIFA